MYCDVAFRNTYEATADEMPANLNEFSAFAFTHQFGDCGGEGLLCPFVLDELIRIIDLQSYRAFD